MNRARNERKAIAAIGRRLAFSSTKANVSRGVWQGLRMVPARMWLGAVFAALLLTGAGATWPAVSAHAHDVGGDVLTGATADAVTAPVRRNRWGANYFPNVELKTQDGNTVRFYDDLLKGKSVVINAMFTICADVCPLELANLVRIRKALGDRVGRDVFIYSISIDPMRDTPAVLKAYAEKFGAGGPGWLFLTGKPEDIKLITRKLALIRARDNPTSRDSHHASKLMIGNEPTGQWTRSSTVDNPQFFAARMGAFLGWREAAPQPSYAQARVPAISEGKRLFLSRCSACHTLGRGDGIGPDLAGVTGRRDHAWLMRYMLAPEVLRAAGDPVAVALFQKYKRVGMPNLGLSRSQVTELLGFLDAHGGAQ